MKKFLMIVLTMLCSFMLVGCKKEEATQTEFMKMVSDSNSYVVSGVMESYYQDGRKQNEFLVQYKKPDLIKVTIKNSDNDDKQIILKNNDGVYVLIPSVNKNFKIKSSWPNNSSYPYLLQSLAKDIANEEAPIVTNDNNSYKIETKTSLHNDAIATRQKIVFDKEKALPKEVLVYDENGDLYVRVVFTKVEFNVPINDEEFVVNKSLETVRLEYKDNKITYERTVSYPLVFPSGSSLIGEDTVSSEDGNDVRTIMKFSGEVGFTIIQEFINDKEVTVYEEQKGEITTVLGNVVIIKSNGAEMYYQGIEYTIGSNDLETMQMLEILKGYMTNNSK